MTTPLVGKPQWNNAILAYLVPPREDMPFQSPRILVFTRTKPEVNHQPGISLPNLIVHDKEVMRRELSDPDHLPCILVQLDEDRQFMYFVMDDTPHEVHKIINARVDEVEDKAAVPGFDPNNPLSPIIMPGTVASPPPAQGGKLIIPGQNQGGSYSGDEIWRVEMDWQITEEIDAALIEQVRAVAMGAKIL